MSSSGVEVSGAGEGEGDQNERRGLDMEVEEGEVLSQSLEESILAHKEPTNHRVDENASKIATLDTRLTIIDGKLGESAIVEIKVGGARGVSLVEKGAGSEDDVIMLAVGEESVASGSKRPRRDEAQDGSMEVDGNSGITAQVRESVGEVIRTMRRQELEDLVLSKIVEAIVVHSEVGKLRSQVLQLQIQKEGMAKRLGTMTKQVATLTSAIDEIKVSQRELKNRTAIPKNIRFQRSVGVQWPPDPSVRSVPSAPAIVRVPESAKNVKHNNKPMPGRFKVTGPMPARLKVTGPMPARFKETGPSSKDTITIPSTQWELVKRTQQGGKTDGPKANPVITSGLGPRQRNVSIPSRQIYPPPVRIVPKQNATSLAYRNAEPGIVDLTEDDDPPTPATSIVQNIPAPAGNILPVNQHIYLREWNNNPVQQF